MVDFARQASARRPHLVEGGGGHPSVPTPPPPSDVRLVAREDELTRVRTASTDVFALAMEGCKRSPTNIVAWQHLESIAHARPHTQQVLALYRSMLERDLPVATRLLLGERAVRFHDEWSDDVEQRLELLAGVLEVDPGATWAFERAALQLTQLGRWESLFALYDRAIATAQGSQRARLLREAAHAARELAGWSDRAALYLEQLFESGELSLTGGVGPADADSLLERVVGARAASPATRRRALQQLRQVYERAGRDADLERALLAALSCADGADAVTLHSEMARRLDAQGQGGRSLEHLAAVLALDPELGREEVVDQLLAGPFEGSLAGCKLQLGHEGGRDLVIRAAAIAKAADPRSARAIDLYARLLLDAPADGSTLASLARLHEARGSYDDLTRALAAAPDLTRHLEAGTHTAGEEDRGECGLLLAHVHVAMCQVEAALPVLEVCLLDNQVRSRALALQLQLLRAQLEVSREGSREDEGHVRALVHALVDGASLADGAEACAYLREAADLLSRRLGAPGDAVPLLERVVATDPADVASRAALADSLRQVGRLGEARALGEGIVQQFGRRHPPERAASHLLLARIARANGQDGEAVRQLELAVAIDPSHAPAQRLLGKILLSQGHVDRAERALQVLLLLQRRAASSGKTDLAVSETLFDLHRVAVLLGDSRRAADALASAFEVASRGGHEALCLERALCRARRYGEALELILQALALDPNNESLHARALETSVWAANVDRYAACLETLAHTALSSGDGISGCALLLRLGNVFERDLGHPDAALAIYLRAEDTSERLVEVWRAIAGVAARVHDRPTRLGALRRLAECPEVCGDERADAFYELADHELEVSDTVDAGLATLERAMADGEPQYERAGRSLRKALQVTLDREPVLRMYESVARAAGDDGMLLDALGASCSSPVPSAAVLQEAYALAVRLQQPERATRLLERAVEVARDGALDPAEGLWALRLLAERCEKNGVLGDAILWMTRAAEISDISESWALLERAAELAAGPAGDLDMAAQTYERLLDREPGHPEIWDKLLKVLRRMARAGNAAPLEFALARAADDLPQPDLRNAARIERAALLLQRSDGSSQAADLLRAALAEDPDHTEAAGMLADLLQGPDNRDELVDLLARSLESARMRDDARAGVAVALKLGGLLSESSPTDAADIFRSALEWMPDHPRLLRRLVAVLDPVTEAQERGDRLERVLPYGGPHRFELALELFHARRAVGDLSGLERALETARGIDPHNAALHDPTRWMVDSLLARAAEQPAEAALLIVKAAQLLRDRLDDSAAARAALESALLLRPESLQVLEQFVQCCLDLHAKDAAQKAVETAIDLCADDSEGKAERLALQASIRSSSGDYEGAVASLEQALALDGDRWLPSLFEALRRARQNALSSGDLEAERQHMLRESDLLGRTGEIVSARALLSDLVSGTFYDREACEKLLNLDLAAERWQDVAKGCRRMLDLEWGPQLIHLALLHADACAKLGTPMEARRSLERAFAFDADSAPVRARLRRVYEEVGAQRELAELLVVEALHVTDADSRFEVLRDAGRLFLGLPEGREAALSPLEEAAKLRPADTDVQLWLVDALVAAHRLGDAEAVVQSAISRHGTKRSLQLAQLQHRMSQIVAPRDGGRHGSINQQLVWLTTAFESFPKCEPIALELAEIATEQRQYDLAMRGFRALLSISGCDPSVRALAYLRQAQIARVQGDSPRAVVLARRALSEHPSMPEASALITELGGRV